MSQRDGFAGGFLAGAIVGGIVGGVLGALFASRRDNETDREDKSLPKSTTEEKFSTEESIEGARRSLEDKIAQLNLAIDDVRQQLGAVNGNTLEKE
ncbi:MAG: hypothetical protein AB4426_24410 [Xenococcaceae cyanobacterium]